MRLLPLIRVAVVLGLSTGNAQINTEAMRQELLTAGWHGTVGGNLGLIAGNSSFLKAKSNLRVDHRSARWHNFLVAQYGFAGSRKDEITNQAFAHLRSVKHVSARTQVEGFLQQQFDRSISLNNRQLVGGGVRFKWFNGPANDSSGQRLSLANGVGIMWEREVTDSAQTAGLDDRDTRLMRSTNYLVIGWSIADRLTFSTTTYFQFALSRPQDYRVLLEGSLQVQITKRITFSANLNLRYDSEPPVGVAELFDLEITNGLSFNL